MQKRTEEMDRGVLNVSQRAFLLKAKKYFYIQAFMRVGIRLGVCMVWFSLFSLLLSCIKNKKCRTKCAKAPVCSSGAVSQP